jgi:eukaryotic-like serine/threonine-protein kinase
MRLSAGDRIGSFQVETLLGAGGMGEVYRAHDTRLGRPVALKLLPRIFATDPDRLSRFEREARLLASLNHPNIGAVYGIEPVGDVTALVMELVDGDDLSVRVRRGPLLVPDALAIARQIAAALEAAHDQGVIHRDLKPANIKVRPDGTVKVLDFGLAKALPSGAGDGETLTVVTEPGLVVGTPAYMSPEQARGEAVDRRTDIWAFGVVLYELLTGVSPFAGKTTADTLAGVLERNPDMARLPAAMPESVRRLIRRCLEKDFRRRLQHIGDARIEIEEALALDDSSLRPGLAAPVVPRQRWQQATIALAIAVLIAGSWWVARRPVASSRGEVIRLSIPSVGVPGPAAFGIRHLAISKDGTRVAYSSANGILVRRISQVDPVIVPRGTNPFFSPDGQWVAFFGDANGETGLLKVPVSGGAVTVVSRTSERAGGGTWLGDGTIVFATTEGLYQVSADGGVATVLARPDAGQQERLFTWPQSMPDGQSVLFTIVKEGSIDGAQIASLNLRTRQRTLVMKGGTAGQYTPTGHLVYAAGSNLKIVTFDPVTGQVGKEPITAPDVVIANTSDNGAAEFALSDSGTLIFTDATVTFPLPRAAFWVDRSGHEEQLPLPPGQYAYPRISPDGTLVAFDIPRSGGNRDISIWNLARKTLIRVTDGPNEDLLPLWSADGTRIFFASNRGASLDVYSQAADGSTSAKLELAAPGAQFPSGFAPDGTKLLVNDGFTDIALLDLMHSDRLEPLLHSPFEERLAVFSPDGKWIAYESNESGDRYEVFIRPFPEVSGRREQVSAAGGRFPLWRTSGKSELFYIDPSGTMMSVPVKLQPTLTVGSPTPLFPGEKPPEGRSGRRYDVSPIDGRFLILRPVATSAADPVDIAVVLNWFEEWRDLMHPASN